MVKHWTEEELLSALQQLSIEIGRTPTKDDIRSCNYCPDPSTYHLRFGGLSVAYQRIGVVPNPVLKNGEQYYSDAELLSLLREFARKSGFVPNESMMIQAKTKPTAKTYKDRFGSINRALKLAGIKNNPLRNYLGRVFYRLGYICSKLSGSMRQPYSGD